VGHFQNNIVADDTDGSHFVTDSYTKGKSIVVTRVRAAVRLDVIDAKDDKAISLMLLSSELDAIIDILMRTLDRVKVWEKANEG